LNAASRKRRIEEALGMVGLSARAHHLPSQLSGGQQQRVAIARVLAGDPKLILADEPTGNLDSSMTREIMDLLERINGEGRRSSWSPTARSAPSARAASSTSSTGASSISSGRGSRARGGVTP
jgi:ABC-type Na+ transport system ATPase subunit NatA